ncbi:MAG: rRNA maturation RNase YbeY [Alphaproteobacteria bacterium]|nr:rRNA maturation RNase YbeY [Alphaproteobacteria bacterium]
MSVAVEAAGWADFLPQAARLARRAGRAALAASGLRTAKRIEVSLLLSDDRRVRALNRRWRAKDRPTNVLAFPAGAPAPRGAPLVLGDVVLALETVRREARLQGKKPADHFQHLVVHGVLHLAGHDHETAAEAGVMESLETRILRRLGIADPYLEAEEDD